jgi:hypothetical protein
MSNVASNAYGISGGAVCDSNTKTKVQKDKAEEDNKMVARINWTSLEKIIM